MIVPFNYGIFSPHISSIDISSSTAVVTGSFYVSTDVLGGPSSNKVIRYTFGDSSPYALRKISEAKIRQVFMRK